MSTQQFFLIELCMKLYKKIRSIFGRKSLIVFGAIVGLLYKYGTKKHDNIPAAPGYEPIIGHTRVIYNYLLSPSSTQSFLNKSTEIHLKNGKDVGMFSIILPTRTQIFICDPKIVDLAFREKFSDAIKGNAVYGTMKQVLGDGIFVSNGETWKKHRSIASHMFTVRSLRDYMFKVFITTTDDLLDKFDELLSINNGFIDFYDMWNRLTFEAFSKVAFGVNVGAISSAPKQSEFAYRFDRALQLIANRVFASIPWKLKRKLRFLGIAPYEYEMDEHVAWLENYVVNIIKDRKEYYKQKISNKTSSEKRKLKRGNTENKLEDRYDLLSLFMDDNKKITDKELRDITINFIIAGKDTTAQTLTWFMYHIFTNNLSEIENKIRQEITTVFGDGNGNMEKSITYEDVSKCRYIECCLKETLRLYPAVPHLVREAVKDIKTPNGYTIRKGDELFVSTYCMGRMPWIWDEPLTFKPERFMCSKKDEPDPSIYPAFNIAPRLCLGKHVALLEAKIAVIKLFKKYKNISAVQGQNIQWVTSPTNQMAPGFKAYLKKK